MNPVDTCFDSCSEGSAGPAVTADFAAFVAVAVFVAFTGDVAVFTVMGDVAVFAGFPIFPTPASTCSTSS
jgi:hypothetical protein